MGDIQVIDEDGTQTERKHNDVHEITDIGDQQTTHDAKGNLIWDPIKQQGYTWDVENKLQVAHLATNQEVAEATTLHWPLDGNGSDASANGYDATAITGTYEAGRFNQGVRLDGDDTFENAAVASALNGSSELTLALWVKADSTGQDRGILFSTSPNGKDEDLGLRYDKSGWGGGGSNLIKASIQTTNGPLQLESASNTQTTGWQHLAITYSATNGKLRLYIDGRETPTTFETT